MLSDRSAGCAPAAVKRFFARHIHSLRFKLIALNVICIMVPMVTVTSYMILSYERQAQEEAGISVSNTLNSAAQSIYSYISETERLMTTIGYDKKVLEELSGPSPVSADGEPSVQPEKSSIILDYLKTSRQDLTSIVVQDEFGHIRYCNKNMNVTLDPDNASLLSVENIDADSDVELLEPYAFWGSHRPVYFSFSEHKNVFSIIQTMKHPYTDGQKLYIIADTDIALFKDIFSGLDFGSPSIAMVLDARNGVVYSSSGVDADLLDKVCSGDRIINMDDMLYHLQEQAIIPSGWRVIILLSDSNLREKIDAVIRSNILISVIMILFSSTTFLFITGSISRSLNEVIMVMRAVKNGDLSANCSEREKGEFGELKRSLNSMIQQLNEYITKEYKLTLSQRDAEYRALQSQIQPHFLYNTLNGFLWLNREGEKDALEKSIIDLTGLLRYTLNPNAVVSLGQEFDFLGKYCELQKLRFEDRMDYAITYDGDVLQILIPKLLLQPLVENFVIHAVEPSVTPCMIRIRAAWEDGGQGRQACITLDDDGCGFDAAHIGQDCVGIRNVRERIGYAYPESRFQISSSPGAGTHIQIQIPDHGGGLELYERRQESRENPDRR